MVVVFLILGFLLLLSLKDQTNIRHNRNYKSNRNKKEIRSYNKTERDTKQRCENKGYNFMLQSTLFLVGRGGGTTGRPLAMQINQDSFPQRVKGIKLNLIRDNKNTQRKNFLDYE